MKGVVVVVALIASIFVCGFALANPPIKEPEQYEQFCEHQLVSGNGTIDTSISIVDKSIALEYYNMMNGDGVLEMDATHVYSQNAGQLVRPTPNCSVNGTGTSDKTLNFWENTKLTYEAVNLPLTGGKYLNSKRFYGGIGADVQEMFSVTEMEKDQTAYFGSTAPYDTFPIVRNDSITHTIGLDTLNSFTGSWGTDASMHKIFYKDIRSQEMFSGEFEIQKEIKFHENPVYEEKPCPCEGIDC